MRTMVTKRELERLCKLQTSIDSAWKKFEKDDIELHYGNGTIAGQLSVASAALESILQEFI